MEVRPHVLRQELAKTYRDIESVEAEMRVEAADMGVAPATLRDTNGGWVFAPLLVAKAQVLHSLVLLNKKEH